MQSNAECGNYIDVHIEEMREKDGVIESLEAKIETLKNQLQSIPKESKNENLEKKIQGLMRFLESERLKSYNLEQ